MSETSPTPEAPYYVPTGDEVELFRAAHHAGLPVLIKGPTGCGKTRFVESMAFDLARPLVTVACHEDLTASDLVGRFLLEGGSTRWTDGPLTTAVRTGSICYLDEVVEARQDTVVVLHPLADHRRQLSLDRTGETLDAALGFTLVVSYNPGYQSTLKDLKESTRQRMIAIEMTWPSVEIEEAVVEHEGGVDSATAHALVELAVALRRLDGHTLREVPSTRTLVSAAQLIAAGIEPRAAARSAIVLPLTDDPRLAIGLSEVVDSCLG